VTVFGIGIDVVENARIAGLIRSHGQRFLDRVYQPDEIEYCRSMRDPAPHFAARFAAKEAVSKAFGTGFAQHINWRDIEVRRKASGQPFVVLHAGAAELAKRLHIETVLVSLSHSQTYAIANALLLKSMNE
jgi:holo-[acyl-carrier protein] synthase